LINAQEPFDPLLQFAAIERLVSKIYYRFSHLFLFHAVLRDFWWGMAREEEQHACILNTCRAIILNYEQETVDPMIGADKARELYDRLEAFLRRGTPALHEFIAGNAGEPVRKLFALAFGSLNGIAASENDPIKQKYLRGATAASAIAEMGGGD